MQIQIQIGRDIQIEMQMSHKVSFSGWASARYPSNQTKCQEVKIENDTNEKKIQLWIYKMKMSAKQFALL